MVGGGSEPIYLPGRSAAKSRLIYRADYASSALHEAAHWCIAGSARRAQIDFGYRYTPPPRHKTEQKRFYKSEERVQALEWIFSDASQVEFHPSADNLEAEVGDFYQQLKIAKHNTARWLNSVAGFRARVLVSFLASDGLSPTRVLETSAHG